MNTELIKEQVKEVISYSQGINNPKVDKLIDSWYQAKKSFISMWGGPIYTHPEPVTFTLDEMNMIELRNEFLDLISLSNPELTDFVSRQTARDFFKNKQSIQSFHNGKEIPQEMKLVRAFKYFEKDTNLLHSYQDAASRFIQKNKITGTLCFSVHPLDFLSSSENDAGWRSCHSLDGEYRAGNLSYMLDKSTIVCYLKSDDGDHYELPNFPSSVLWNNKKWRMLLFLSDNRDGMFAGRQYPFFAPGALSMIKTVAIDAIMKNYGYGALSDWTDWEDTVFESIKEKGSIRKLYTKNWFMRGHLKPRKDFITDRGTYHFNDLLHSTCYTPYYCYRDYMGSEPPHFTIGSDRILCLRCGEDVLLNSGTFQCKECEIEYGTEDNEDIVYCDCCGRRVCYVDAQVDAHGFYVCEYCAEDMFTRCECCGELYPNDEIHFDSKTNDYRCDECHS